MVTNQAGLSISAEGIKFPTNAPLIDTSTGTPFFFTVEMYPRVRQKLDAPSELLNVPEIFC